MSKDKENSETETTSQKSYWHNPTIIAILIMLFAILIIAIVYLIIEEMSIQVTDEGLVITFLGVIATFVVVGNFMQTAEIKKETLDRLNENKEAISAIETTLNTKIQTQHENLIERINTSETNSAASISKQVASLRKNIDDTTISTASNVSGITENLISLLGKTLLFVESQKKLFIEFIKRLSAYDVEYSKGEKSEIELRDIDAGKYSMYDLKQEKVLANKDYSLIKKICNISINDKVKIEAVLDAYSTYVKIVSLTIPPADISGQQESSSGYDGQAKNDTSLSDKDNSYKN